MLVDSATNCLTQAEDHIRDMLCDTADFQAWVNAWDAESAKKYVFFHSVPDSQDTVWPDDEEVYSADFWSHLRNYAIVSTALEDGFSFTSASAPSEFLASGVVQLQLYRYFEDDNKRSDIDTRLALNETGDILANIWPLSLQAGYPCLTDIDVTAFDWGPENQRPDGGRQFRLVAFVVWTMGNESAQ